MVTAGDGEESSGGPWEPQCPGDGGGDGGGTPPVLTGCDAADFDGTLWSEAVGSYRVRVTLDGTILFFNPAAGRIDRWSVSTWAPLPPIELGLGAYDIAYSESLNTLYVGYSNGDITRVQFDIDLTEDLFAVLEGSPMGMQVAGAYLVAVDDVGAWESHHVFDMDGGLTNSVDWNHPSPEYIWSEANSRLYFFRDGTSPNDLMWEEIDQGTGLIVDDGESPYHGAYDIEPPIRVSDDGAFVVLGTGHVYDGVSLLRPFAVPVDPTDALWLEDSLVTIRPDSAERTLIERWSIDSWARVDARVVRGYPRAIRAVDGEIVVASSGPGEMRLHPYVPGVDGDGDGVDYDNDAFPIDPAASIDNDRDGAVDVWNGDCTELDSLVGLSGDAHPELAACALAGPCQPSDVVVSSELGSAFADLSGVIYMLAADDRFILRWSSEMGEWLDPIPLQEGAVRMAFHEPSGSIFVGYASGWISRLDACGPTVETHFAVLPDTPHGLVAAGNFIFGADPSGAWNTQYVFDLAGNETNREDWTRRSNDYGWCPQLDRLFFLSTAVSPRDLYFVEVDQATGVVLDDDDSPYHGTYGFRSPLAVSVDGDRVLAGPGDVFDTTSLTHLGSLPVAQLTDAVWRPTGLLTIRPADVEGETVAERWGLGLGLAPESSAEFDGEPYRVFATPFGRRIVTIVAGQPVVSEW